MTKGRFKTLTLIGGALAAIAFTFGALTVGSEERRWEKFKQEHDCKPVDNLETTWKCNDGKEYKHARHKG